MALYNFFTIFSKVKFIIPYFLVNIVNAKIIWNSELEVEL